MGVSWACSTEESDMAEHNEHDSSAEGATPEPAEAPSPASGQGPGDRSATHAYEGAAPHPQAETLSTGAPTGGRWSGRFRHWSASGTVRMGAVALVAGLVGGLVGGGIVAAFSDDGHDHAVPVRFERGMQRGGPPGFYGPRYYRGQPPNGRWNPPNAPGVPQPNPPATPVPAPTG
jgi:hypothetical protein